MAGRMRRARPKHVLKYQRSHSKVGNRQYGICSCLRCGKDVAVEAPLFKGIRLCDGCIEQAERWLLAQRLTCRNAKKPPKPVGTHNEIHGFKTK